MKYKMVTFLLASSKTILSEKQTNYVCIFLYLTSFDSNKACDSYTLPILSHPALITCDGPRARVPILEVGQKQVGFSGFVLDDL